MEPSQEFPVREDSLFKYYNIPFKWHGNTFEGVDCVGLVELFYKEEWGVEIHMPDAYDSNSNDPVNYFEKFYKEVGFKETSIPHQGDLVSFKNGKGTERHCAILLNAYQALHADSNGVSVIDIIRNPVWYRKVAKFYTLDRIPNVS